MKTTFVKTQDQIAKIKEASHIVALVHAQIRKHLRPGVTTRELDTVANRVITENGGKPSFLGYGGFPNSICTSINNVLVHGIPSGNETVKEGDIISIDVGVEKNGYHGDAARTYIILPKELGAPYYGSLCLNQCTADVEHNRKAGSLTPELGVKRYHWVQANAKRNYELLKASYGALDLAINSIKPGMKVYELGEVIENFVKSKGFNVPKEYVGHGIGSKLHEDPYIPNYKDLANNEVLVPGMTICIEPMLIDGKDELFVDPLDKWTVRTKHHGNCAHVEHVVLITEQGAEILDK